MVLSVYFLHAVKIPIARCLEMAVGCRAFHSHYSGVINFTLLVGRRGAGGNGLTIKKKKKAILDLDFSGLVYLTRGKFKMCLGGLALSHCGADDWNGSL